MIKLYDYQQQALDAEARHRREHPDETRLAIVLPTGTGKGTILAKRAVGFADAEHDRLLRAYDAGVITHGGRQRVLILVHTDELVNDLAARCRLAAQDSEFPITVGIVKAGQDDVYADIIVGSVQTLVNPERRARISGVGLVIVDECDYGITAYEPILQYFGCSCSCPTTYATYEGPERDCPEHGDGSVPPTPALGFTATMKRNDGAGLGLIWQNVVFTRDISWAVRKGFLVQPIGYRLEIGLPSGSPESVDAFAANNVAILDNQIAESIAPERIVEKWRELAEGRQTIVFAPLVRSARKITHTFLQASVIAATIHGDMPDNERRQVIADFKAGEIQVLVNAMVLTRGFDHPNVSCVIVARPTKSESLYIQMAGRGLRRVPGIPVEDQDCILISLADGVSDLRCHVDLSDRPLDPKAEGPLTVMEDAWDIGKHLDDEARHWTGKVDATQFDPLVSQSSKVWAKTRGGHWFLPISADREYVFLLGTSIYALTRDIPVDRSATARVARLHADLPDLELAMQVAEDEATERGGDLGALLADRSRPWRKQTVKPGDRIYDYACRLGLSDETHKIMTSKSGGKAGKVSDLIRRVEASRSIDKAVERIKAREAAAA